MRQEYPTARDVARKELREVLASTEALLAAVRDVDGEHISELRERLTTTMAEVKEELGSSFLDGARETFSKARDTATSVHEFVQEHPWPAVGIAGGLGLLIGLAMRD